MPPTPTSGWATQRHSGARRTRSSSLALAFIAVLLATLVGPAAASAASRTYLIPRSIDRTGTHDVAAAVQRFVNRVPNGSTVAFRTNGHYRLDAGIRLDGRHDLAIDGHGATLKVSGCSPTNSAFVLGYWRANSSIKIRNLTLIGSNPDVGTGNAYHPGCEGQMGVAIYQSDHVSISHVTIKRVYGDCVYVDYGDANHNWSRNVRIADSKCYGTGRSGIAITAGSHITVERVRFDKIGMYPLNIEPNTSDGGGTYVTFRHNRIGSYGHVAAYGVLMVCTNGGAKGAPIHHLTISNNRATGGTLATYIQMSRTSHVVFKDNVSTVRATGPVVVIDHSDTVTVTGNTQPMAHGDFAWFRDSTNVVYHR